jgi:hypothetical protein
MKYKSLVSAVALTSVIATGCSNPEVEGWSNGEVNIDIIESPINAENDSMEKAAQIAGVLIEKINCYGNFTFAATELGLGPNTGATNIAAAVTDPVNRTVTYNSRILTEMSSKMLESVTVHEVVHLCAGEEKELTPPLMVDGVALRYAIGFGLSTKLAASNDEYFEFIDLEEGMATAMGDLESGTESDTDYYSFVGNAFAALLSEAGMSLGEAQVFHSKSDVLGFVAAVMGIEEHEVTDEVFISVLAKVQP